MAVPGDGDPQSEILFIGEGPGRKKMKLGTRLSGRPASF
jgi:uracil-DNA glycosylase